MSQTSNFDQLVKTISEKIYRQGWRQKKCVSIVKSDLGKVSQLTLRGRPGQAKYHYKGLSDLSILSIYYTILYYTINKLNKILFCLYVCICMYVCMNMAVYMYFAWPGRPLLVTWDTFSRSLLTSETEKWGDFLAPTLAAYFLRNCFGREHSRQSKLVKFWHLWHKFEVIGWGGPVPQMHEWHKTEENFGANICDIFLTCGFLSQRHKCVLMKTLKQLWHIVEGGHVTQV